MSGTATPRTIEVRIPAGAHEVLGTLTLPATLRGVVIFVHDGGGRHRLRNHRIAWSLPSRGLATLVLDLHTPARIRGGHVAYDVADLARRIQCAVDWIRRTVPLRELPIGCVAASAGGTAALVAAARHPGSLSTIVAFSARVDDAEPALRPVPVPALLVVGAEDEVALASNRVILGILPPGSELVAVPGARYLFEEPGVLDYLMQLSADWLTHHLTAADGGEDGHERAAT